MTNTNEFEVLADTDAEQIVLGAAMLSATVADQVVEALTVADFYKPAHSVVFDAVSALVAAGDPVDAHTVLHHLMQGDMLAAAGGAPYLHTLIAAVPVTASAPWYAERVAEWAYRRAIVEVCTRAIQMARSPAKATAEVVETVQAMVHQATTTRHTDVEAFDDALDATVDAAIDPDVDARGLSTGLGSLDDLIGGLKPGQLIIVAGRPGMGKSVLVTDFIRACALRQHEPALMFSLEMTRGEVIQRILAAEAGVSLTRITNSQLRDHEPARLRACADKLRGALIEIDDEASVDLAYIRSRARKTQATTGLGLIVVDYLQLMSGSGRNENRATEIGEISRGLKVLAKELGVPVVAAAQLNRLAEQRSDRRPQLSDLRESGSLEQDANIVVLLHRPDYYDQEHVRSGEVDLIVAKNRSGPQDTVVGAAQLHYARITDFK